MCNIYRGMKRGRECVDGSDDEQTDRKLSVKEYKSFVIGIFRTLCNMPIGPTKTRYEYKHTIRNPENPCAYVDIRMFIDIRPTGADTMEATFFRINDESNNKEDQIAHATLKVENDSSGPIKVRACLSKVEELLNSMFGKEK